jgi:predicted DNA-binding WGR domain protein
MQWVYYEKIAGKQRRWYYLASTQSVWGDPTLVRQWGRIGHHGGRKRADIFDDEAERTKAWRQVCAARRRHGYSVVKTDADAG